MGTFGKYKGVGADSSFCLGLNSKVLGVSEHFKLECRVAGLWLLDFNHWLEQMKDAREFNRDMYFSRFPPSIESLSSYLLNGPLKSENQILFLQFLQHLLLF